MWVSSPLSLVFAQKFLSPEVCPNPCIDYTSLRDVYAALGPILQFGLIRAWGVYTSLLFMWEH